jgi:hypothetical protein
MKKGNVIKYFMLFIHKSSRIGMNIYRCRSQKSLLGQVKIIVFIFIYNIFLDSLDNN